MKAKGAFSSRGMPKFCAFVEGLAHAYEEGYFFQEFRDVFEPGGHCIHRKVDHRINRIEVRPRATVLCETMPF